MYSSPTVTAAAHTGRALLVAVGAMGIGAGLMSGVAAGADHRDGKTPHPYAAASTIVLNETAHLHLVGNQGVQLLREEGQASGTLRGPLSVTIHVGYMQATVTFTAHTNGGTLSGRGVESYYVSGKTGHFDGQMSVTRGSGTYAGASASDLHATGVIKQADYGVVMQVTGKLRR